MGVADVDGAEVLEHLVGTVVAEAAAELAEGVLAAVKQVAAPVGDADQGGRHVAVLGRHGRAGAERDDLEVRARQVLLRLVGSGGERGVQEGLAGGVGQLEGLGRALHQIPEGRPATQRRDDAVAVECRVEGKLVAVPARPGMAGDAKSSSMVDDDWSYRRASGTSACPGRSC